MQANLPVLQSKGYKSLQEEQDFKKNNYVKYSSYFLYARVSTCFNKLIDDPDKIDTITILGQYSYQLIESCRAL
ncbi:hypothetical protein C2G38_2235073 [Gigaspora rosea]|uniref:Uncharacterized protein n=1 Tax=Gigaspora rosea TaxID=44941 RepID=A0A397TS19_9GLOM|nr:hypothetical protein C2G38_2235073 [Gigaspora rosea]